MEYINKNESQQVFDKYLFNQRKINHTPIEPYYKNKIIFHNFKTINRSNNNIPFIKKKENKSSSYYKNNNMIGFHLPEYELINLKREEAKHLFPNKYVNENKKRILNKIYFIEQQKNNSFKYRNNYNISNNLDNIYLKTDYNKNILIGNKISKNNLNINSNNTKKVGNNIDSYSFRNNNIKKKENQIILPLNIENNQKKYINNDDNGNFMEKYEYYLMNLNKNKKNNSEQNKNKYFNTKTNFSHNNKNNNYSNNNLLEIKPYKYKKYNINQEEKTINQENNNTDLQNKNNTDGLNTKKKLKIINNKPKLNTQVNNYFKEILNKLQRKLLCINEKNEDILKADVVSLLGDENEKLNNDVNKIMNIICKIKNFSFKEKSHNLIPLINSIIIDKQKQKNTIIQKLDKKIDSNENNNNKLYLLNKDLKVFDLDNNFKYGYDYQENQIGNMFYNLIIQKSKRRKFKKKIKSRRNSHLNFTTNLQIKNIQRFKRYKSTDNIYSNNEDNDSFYIPSEFNSHKKKILKKQINFPFRNKSNYRPAKTSEKNGFNFTENLPKLFGDNLVNRTSKNKKINFPVNINISERTYKRNNNKENEGNELKNFLNTYKPKNNKVVNKKNKVIKTKEKSEEKNTDKEDSKKKSKNKDSNKQNNNISLNEENDKDKKINYTINNTKSIKDNNITNINNTNTNIITSNNENNNFNYTKKKSINKNFKSRQSRRFSVLSFMDMKNNNIQNNPNKNNNIINNDKEKDKLSNRDKAYTVERRRKPRLSTRFKKMTSSQFKTNSKSPRKKLNKDSKKNITINLNHHFQKQEDLNNYTKFFDFLNSEEKKEDKNNSNSNITMLQSPQKTKKNL